MKRYHNLTPEKLIHTLIQLRNEGYIFRGQYDAKHELTPNAFRPSTLEKYAKDFPIPQKEWEEWFDSKKIKESIGGWGGDPLKSKIQEICRLLLVILQLNYQLSTFYKKKPAATGKRDKKMMDQRESLFYTEKGTFFQFFDFVYPQLLTRISLTGKILQMANPAEEFTGFDETFPQHYGCGTTMLDWTFNPYVAIFFALDSYLAEEVSKNGIYLASEPPHKTKYLALYAYKEASNTKNDYLCVQSKDALKENQRATRHYIF